MFYNDHAPPHFHALYGEFEAIIDLASMVVIEGDLPSRALALALEWAAMHRDELAANWELCRINQSPRKIDPLK
jgi:hypothetical protein